ncbi:coiled-coil domain-containing protein 170-like [Choloepus didactylus]|uniref:coiled-coil domain-containing protein 170-like n=1 Tax=Choloepus didactylus TaxID=27675 RepID=UPI00189E7DAC|nr:coiled-coil domain-containing protein 170-like [Choloepus didactylus]
MSDPQVLNHSDPGQLTTKQSKEPQEAMRSEVKHLSSHISWKNRPVANFDPSLKVIPTRNLATNNKKAADTGHPDLGGLLVKNKNLLAEVRNLQNKLLIKETSLQEMKSELKSYKENNAQQSSQITSLKDDIKDLKELNASLTRIKTLKNTNIQILERGNWDLTERIKELENHVRVLLVEREKAQHKSDLLETKLAGVNRFSSCMNLKGPEDSIDMFTMKDSCENVQIKSSSEDIWTLPSHGSAHGWCLLVLLSWVSLLQLLTSPSVTFLSQLDKDEAILAKSFEKDNTFHPDGPKDGHKLGDKCQQDMLHKEKQVSELKRPPYSFIWETKTAQSQYQNLLSQLAALLSNSVVPVSATEEAVKERIQEIGANEQSWKSITEGLQQEIQMLTKQLEQLHHLYEEVVQESSQAEEKYRERKKSLKRLEGKIDVNDFFQGRLDFDRNKQALDAVILVPIREFPRDVYSGLELVTHKENCKTKNSHISEHDKKFKQLEKDNKQHISLNIQQNLQTTTTQILEEKIQKLQKQLDDLKLSNKNMKTQLTKVNFLKDKTIERLRQSLTKAETIKEKAVMKTDNLKTTVDSAEQDVRSDKERAHQMSDTATREPYTVKSTFHHVSGQEQELVGFRETITKMLGFNVKTADHEIINQLCLIIQAYEGANKPKIPSDSEIHQDNK